MRKLIQGAMVAATLTAFIAPGLAQARPWHHGRHHHRVCTFHHHHRVCMWG